MKATRWLPYLAFLAQILPLNYYNLNQQMHILIIDLQ